MLKNHNLGKIRIAQSFKERYKGLMGEKVPQSLVITPCIQVHTFFMRFPIDVIFYDSGYNVVHIEKNLSPWRISKKVKNAQGVVELPAGTADNVGIKIGDKIYFKGG